MKAQAPAPALPAARMLLVNMSANQVHVVKTFTVMKTFIRQGV